MLLDFSTLNQAAKVYEGTETGLLICAYIEAKWGMHNCPMWYRREKISGLEIVIRGLKAL